MEQSANRTGGESGRRTIFISHLTAERKLADLLARPFDLVRDSVEVFRSWTEQSLPPGSDWFRELREALDSTSVMIVLCSRASLRSPWVGFELGAAWQKSQEDVWGGGQQINIIPVCHSGLLPTDLPPPFQIHMALRAGVEEDLARLYRTVARYVKGLPWSDKALEKLVLSGLIEEVKEFENDYIHSVVDAGRNLSFLPLQVGASASYCQLSSRFEDYRKKIVGGHRRRGYSDRSNLWYAFINTEEFSQVKEQVQEVFSEATRRDPLEERLEDVSVWSLMGAAELLVRFRADETTQAEVEKRLREVLKGHLESTHMNPEGIRVINVWDERVPQNLPGKPPFERGALIPCLPLPKRSIKVFVKLYFPEGVEPNENRDIANQLVAFRDTVESYSVSHEESGSPVDIVIEAHYPCGYFDELQRLSNALEEVLRRRLIKETYIAYDLSIIKRGEVLRHAITDSVGQPIGIEGSVRRG